ncbi:MAG: hypothetical protein J6336_04015 [Kiritimatiellae bacterium]|nr:hypothetical protein [Kiritimatiellia bacterium]
MRRNGGWMAILVAVASGVSAETVRFDFETGDAQGWQVVDGAFEVLISNRAVEHHAPKPYTKEGTWFLSTLEAKDGHPEDGFKGIVESPVVILESPEITLKVGGGGKGRSEVYVAVCSLDGKELKRFTGENVQTLFDRKVALPDQVGKPIFFRVVDQENGGWAHITLDAVVCQGRIDPAASAERFARRKRELLGQAMAAFDRAEAAVRELGGRFPDYPAQSFLTRLGQLREASDFNGLEAFLKEALVKANPLVTAAPILYVSRPQYPPDHHNTATIFQCGEINHNSYRSQGALKVLDAKSGTVRDLVPELPGRTPRDPEVSPDGKRVVFAMREGKEMDYHIWTVNTDGSELKRLTFAAGVSDIDPVWLPDGDIVFGSTREPKYCMCNRHIMCNLYRMKPNGANIHQIGKSTLFEGHAAVRPDGRILYDRWEYVDRNFGDAQGLWVCNPDGTGHAIYWGNNTTSPGGVINARPLSTASKVITVMGSCHDRPWGALALIDRSRGVDGSEPVVRTWPADYIKRIHVNGEDFDSTRSIRLKYADPFPLDDEHFICSRMTGEGEEMGRVYLDLFGNEVLFHREAPGCHTPVALRPSPAAPVQPMRRNFSDPNGPGRFYVQNVYIGTHMANVKPGAIKALRIVESPEKRQWTRPTGWFGHGEEACCMNWHSFENKRILGTVPVEADGSAYFEVPGNTFVYFQALDEEGKMVQSMRSGAYVQPGETYGCVGCHENRVGDIPAPSARPQAMTREPSKLNGWYGPARFFSFQREVQPVFTRHCVSCHDYGKRPGEKVNLSGDRDAYFCTSYTDLWALGMIRCVGGGPAEIQQAYSWGSHASSLTRKLYGHGKTSLTPEERDRIITWMDINAVYYPVYECAYPGNPGGRSPLTKAEHDQLTALTGVPIRNSHGARQRAQLDFDRPASSRILDPVRAPEKREKYEAALAIIQTGAERLKQTPRADMEGFVPCEKDREREAKYQRRLAEERRVYQAIREGREVFDAIGEEKKE